MKEIQIRQDNAITKAAYDMTALEKNIMYVLISKINAEDFTASKSYFVHAREIIDRTGDDITPAALKRATKLLITRYFETWVNKDMFLQATFVSSAIYHIGKGVIEIEVSKNVLPLFAELKERFTTVQLNTALSLNSKYSKRIYEFVSMLKSMKDPTQIISLIDLKKMLLVIDSTGNDTYPKFSDFKKRVLDPSLTEINNTEGIDLNFKYIALGDKNMVYNSKGGRKPVTAIKFLVTPISKNGQNSSEVNTDDILILRLCKEFGLREDQARVVIAANERKYVLSQLYAISLDKRNIKNIGAYTAKVFNV